MSINRKDIIHWFENEFPSDAKSTTKVERFDNGKARINYSVINKTEYNFSLFSYKITIKDKEQGQIIGTASINVDNWESGQKKSFHSTINLGNAKNLIIVFHSDSVSYKVEWNQEDDAQSTHSNNNENAVNSNIFESGETRMFVINKDINKTETGIKWMDDGIGNMLSLIDLLAKWSYEAEHNYDSLPIPLGKLNVTPSIPPVNSMTDYGFDVWMSVNEFYSDAVKMWNGYKSNVSDNLFDPYYKHCSQYVQEYFDDLGVFEATNGLCPYWSDDSAALGWYKIPLYECQSRVDLRKFMIEVDKLLKKRYPENNISVTVPDGGSTSGGCYIATAVYGSYDCPQVWTLRRFRDETLLKSSLGRLFVKAYYAVSPSVVKVFGDTECFNSFWRRHLDKAVDNLQRKGYKNTPYSD